MRPMSNTNAILAYGFYDSPVGSLLVAGDEACLHMASFPTENYQAKIKPGWVRDDSIFANVYEQLDAYFAGKLERFDLPLRLAGSCFQNAVWRALCDIPFGETITYGEQAKRIGRPGGAQAVGAANGANPIPIIVPCHRVIGANNTLTGFGGGIETKRFLLEHEIKYTPHKRLI